MEKYHIGAILEFKNMWVQNVQCTLAQLTILGIRCRIGETTKEYMTSDGCWHSQEELDRNVTIIASI